MSKRNVNFIFGIHNHQPVGNFPEVFEKAYREAYQPFMEVMARHPKIKWSLHCTGILWDFLFDKHPEYIEQVRSMVSSGQVEILTGGYYEPILAVIPDRDKVGQIRKLSDFIEKEFGKRPKGMWLAERVWEPHLPRVLAEAGVEFTVVDDAHFAAAGGDVESLRGYYQTEEQGTPLDIFPISQRLRYYIPFNTVEKTIEYMGSAARDDGRSMLSMADDGEKFGLWPETYKHVYLNGWLNNFLTAVDNNLGWITPLTFSEYRAAYPPEGRIYLPAASYFEMSEWSLPQDAQDEFEKVVRQFDNNPPVKRFLRGGFWRNFLTKYAESNNMHKKMLRVSAKADGAGKSGEAAKDALYAGQCNCAYWHGVFGGLYLPHLRTAVYQKLIEAESLAETGRRGARVETVDFDGDGRDEVLYEGKTQNLYLAPHAGGTLFEWDIFCKKLNLLNVLTRRPEAYHRRLREFLANPELYGQEIRTIHDLVMVKEKNLDNYLVFDWHRRSSLVDHFLHPDTAFENFRRSQYGEQGDFVLGEYACSATPRSITLSRSGTVWDRDNAVPVTVTKKIIPSQRGFKVSYQIRNTGAKAGRLIFAPELCFAFSYPVNGEGSTADTVSEWKRRDEGFGFELAVRISRPVTLWTFPLETVSLSEGGFERTYQGTVVAPLVKEELAAGSSLEFDLVIQIGELSPKTSA